MWDISEIVHMNNEKSRGLILAGLISSTELGPQSMQPVLENPSLYSGVLEQFRYHSCECSMSHVAVGFWWKQKFELEEQARFHLREFQLKWCELNAHIPAAAALGLRKRHRFLLNSHCCLLKNVTSGVQVYSIFGFQFLKWGSCLPFKTAC